MTRVKFVHGVVRSISRVRGFALVIGLLLLSVVSSEARPYRLAWDRNIDGATAGYRVYYGTSAGAYQPAAGIDVGNVQEFTIDLTEGRNYYFVVRAYSSLGALSAPSTELRFTVPLGATISLSTASVSPGATITASVAGGPGNRLDWVGFFASGASSTGATDWKYLNGTRTAPATGVTGATLSFVAPSNPGTYEVRFYSSVNALLATSIPITVGGTPSVTALPSSLSAGQTITVAVANGPASRLDWVALYPSTATSATAYMDWKHLNGSQTPPATGVANATVTFTAPSLAGQYRVRFMYNGGTTVLATSGLITVGTASAVPTVTPSVTTLAPGSSLVAQIRNGPAGRNDWVGLFAIGAPNTSAVAMYYLNGTLTAPATGLANANVTFTAPQQAGQYNLRFFPNNSMTPLATSAAITVTSVTAPSTPPPTTAATVTPSVNSVVPGGSVTAQVRNGPGGRTDWVALYAAGAGQTAFSDWFYLNGSKTAPATGAASANVVFRMPTTLGQYTMRLFANNTYTLLATGAAITVTSTTTTTTTSTNASVTPSATSVARGSLINLTVANGPGTRLDWIGVYLSGQTGANFVDWTFLNGTKVAPATGLRNTTFPLRVPSTPGTYVMRFYTNNSYTLIANSVNIVVY